MLSFFKKIFFVEYMVKPQALRGELPKSRAAYSEFIKLAWPAMIESLFVFLTNFIDSLMVSRASETAVAAVGVTSQPRMLFYILFFAITSATVAVVSRRYGEQRREDASRCAAQNLSISVIVAVIELAIAFLVAEPLLYFSGAQTDTIAEAMTYFKITIVGMMFYSFGCVLNAAQRGTGRTKITMRSTLCGNLLNVVLNFLLINGVWIFPRLGVKGAAIATLLGQFCSFVISLCSYFGKKSYLKLKLSYFFKIEKETLNALKKVGGGAGVENFFMRLGMFMFAKVVADLGTAEMTTHQICMNMINMSFACGDGLGAAASAIVGQNLGRGRPDVSLMFGKVAQRIAWGFSSVLFLTYTIGGEALMKLFTDNPEIIKEGVGILWIVAFVSLTQVSQIIFTGSLRGAGDTKYNAVISFISTVLVRPTLAYVLCNVFHVGVIGAWFALGLDQYARFFCVTIRFYKGKWMNIKL